MGTSSDVSPQNTASGFSLSVFPYEESDEAGKAVLSHASTPCQGTSPGSQITIGTLAGAIVGAIGGGILVGRLY